MTIACFYVQSILHFFIFAIFFLTSFLSFYIFMEYYYIVDFGLKFPYPHTYFHYLTF